MNSVQKSYAAGVDIGGSHITAALIDLEDRTVVQGTWCREPVNAGGTAEEIINTWASVISNCFKEAGMNPGYIGIAMPGPFDYQQGISLIKHQDKFKSLYNLNVRELMAAKLGIEPSAILFDNDASCFLQGELFSGIGKGYTNVIGLTLGTGFGSAIASDSGVVDAGFWCAPFKDGIAEDYLSGRSLVRTYSLLSNTSIDNAKELSLKAEHDANAKETFVQYGLHLAEFLNPVVTEKVPELIVFGGSISNAYNLFSPSVQYALHHKEVKLGQSALGENAALIGAASMWKKELIVNN